MHLKIFVFRHTETPDNRDHLFSGTRDVDLTETGIEQAGQIAEMLKDAPIDVAYTSHLIRCRHTLQIVLEKHKYVPVCIDPRIRERSYGWLQGQSKDNWAQRAYPIFKLFHRSYKFSPPGGESLYHVRQRVLPFVEEMVKQAKKHTFNVAICTHGNSIRGIREYFENLREDKFNEIETKVGELFEYQVEIENGVNGVASKEV